MRSLQAGTHALQSAPRFNESDINNYTKIMNEISNNTYKFGDFLFDANKFALYYKNQLIKNIAAKSLQVLAVLLRNANALASHDEIIEQVWGAAASGITSDNVAQYISKLRKALAEYEPDEKFIESVKGRGYMFVRDVEFGEIEISQELPFLQSEPLFAADKTEAAPQRNNSRRNFMKPVYFIAALIAVSVISIVACVPSKERIYALTRLFKLVLL